MRARRRASTASSSTGRRGGGPSSTSTCSPRGSCASTCATASPSVPRHTSSYSFVSSRAIGDPPLVPAHRGEVARPSPPRGSALRRSRSVRGSTADVGQSIRAVAARARAGTPRPRTAPSAAPRARAPTSVALGPGTSFDPQSRFEAHAHEPLAGVGDARHPRVGTRTRPGRRRGSAPRAPRRGPARCGRGRRPAAVRPVRPRAISSARVRRVSSAAITSAFAQRLHRARREIAEIADRRRHQDERALIYSWQLLTAALSRTMTVLPRRAPTARTSPRPPPPRIRPPDEPATRGRAGMRHHAQHRPSARAERDVDGEPHPDRVHLPARPQHQRAVDPVSPEQPTPPRSSRRADLRRTRTPHSEHRVHARRTRRVTLTR